MNRLYKALFLIFSATAFSCSLQANTFEVNGYVKANGFQFSNGDTLTEMPNKVEFVSCDKTFADKTGASSITVKTSETSCKNQFTITPKNCVVTINNINLYYEGNADHHITGFKLDSGEPTIEDKVVSTSVSFNFYESSNNWKYGGSFRIIFMCTN